jgi:hypothetical protein
MAGISAQASSFFRFWETLALFAESYSECGKYAIDVGEAGAMSDIISNDRWISEQTPLFNLILRRTN